MTAPSPSAAEASYTDTGPDKAPKEAEAGSSPASILETDTGKAAEAYLSDSGNIDTPGFQTTPYDCCNDV
ncbi:hypothetical protein V499_02676 [Pseudogymnoascus sp. VKM F-103]|nr:hypothetical protein V499_02676 [Pseudogymnoascus sp. VKM F-103]